MACHDIMGILHQARWELQMLVRCACLLVWGWNAEGRPTLAQRAEQNSHQTWDVNWDLWYAHWITLDWNQSEHIEATRTTVAMVWFCLLGWFNLPDKGSNHSESTDHGWFVRGFVKSGELPGKWSDVLWGMSVSYGEVKLSGKQSPPDLLSIKPLCCLEVCKVHVVSPHDECMSWPFQPAPPFL